MQLPDLEDVIETFQLERHVEGGYFREDFRSEVEVPGSLIGRAGKRSYLTTCYYLLPEGDRSVFHKVDSNEIWAFLFGGGPVDLYTIDAQGSLETTSLGIDIIQGETPKHLVKKNAWFGALPRKGSKYAFFSTIVFPGFEYTGWEKGEAAFLKTLCPHASKIIDLLT